MAFSQAMEKRTLPLGNEKLLLSIGKEFDSYRRIVGEKGKKELRGIECLDFQSWVEIDFRPDLLKDYSEEKLISKAKNFLKSETPRFEVKAWLDGKPSATGPISLTSKKPLEFYNERGFLKDPHLIPFCMDIRLKVFQLGDDDVGLWIVSVSRAIPFPSPENFLLEKEETAWKGCSIQVFPNKIADSEKWIFFERLLREFLADWVIACSDN